MIVQGRQVAAHILPHSIQRVSQVVSRDFASLAPALREATLFVARSTSTGSLWRSGIAFEIELAKPPSGQYTLDRPKLLLRNSMPR